MPVGYEAGVIEHHRYYCDHIPNWGINLDIGHAYMSVFSDENFFKFFDAFKGRIWEIHQNGVNHFWDNNMMMEHQPVHLNNTIDFESHKVKTDLSGIAQLIRANAKLSEVVLESLGLIQGGTKAGDVNTTVSIGNLPPAVTHAVMVQAIALAEKGKARLAEAEVIDAAALPPPAGASNREG